MKTTTIGLSIDTAAKDATNADFVTSDGANKDGISNTEDDTLTFTGQLNKQFIQNGGKVLVKITDLAGHIVSSAYVEPQTESANTWTYKHLGPLIEGQYVVKAILVDHVGNMVSATDQAFLVDKTIAAWNPEGVTNTGSPTVHTVNYNNYSFSVNEYGTYQFNSGSVKTYTGGKLDFDAAGKTYESGSFKLDFWDQAGNLTSITNTDQKWIFGAADTPLSLGSTDPGYLGPKNFTGMDTLGSIGKLEIASNFDMASLYDGIASVADQAAANHIAMSNTTNVTLTLSMGDVLALGVTNSFSVDANSLHKEQIQMLVDGQSGDTLNLDGLVNGLNLTWDGGQTSFNGPLTLGLEQYNVYTNVALDLALFVDTSITVNVL